MADRKSHVNPQNHPEYSLSFSQNTYENSTNFPHLISQTNYLQLNSPDLTHQNPPLPHQNPPLLHQDSGSFPLLFEDLDFPHLSSQIPSLPSPPNKSLQARSTKSMVIEDHIESSLDLETFPKSAEILESQDFHDLFLPRRSTRRSSNVNPQSKTILKTPHSPSQSSPLSSKKRIPWTPAEDEELKRLYNEYGAKWAKIASLMIDRTGKQARDRYLHVLVPNISKAPWTDEEDKIILMMVETIGAQWKKISESLQGRTELQAKNRYYTFLKKKGKKRKEIQVETTPMTEENDLEEEKEMSSSKADIDGSQCLSSYSIKTPDPTDMISYDDNQVESVDSNYWIDFGGHL